MRIYLDSCSYNRPYDDLSNIIINLEAQAKLYIQKKIQTGEYELVTSEILLSEINDCPFDVRKKGILDYMTRTLPYMLAPIITPKSTKKLETL